MRLSNEAAGVHQGAWGHRGWLAACRARAATSKVAGHGFLGPTSLSAWSVYVPAFIQRLGELGWIDGRTVAIEYRWADGREERYAEIAAEFARNKVNVIVTGGSSGAAVKRATSVIPIVLAVSNDPVGDGLVASLARPGGNVTGLSVLAPELAGVYTGRILRLGRLSWQPLSMPN
jgi:putative tryptophan/tyrosine transport system substrate-binding protein